MDVTIKDFCFEHLDLFAWREDDFKTYNVNSEFIKAFVNADEKAEIHTFVYDGRVVCIGGIVQITPKTGYAFSLFSRYADGCKVPLARSVRRMFKNMVEDMGLHRVTTYNRIKDHNKWCEWLGFKWECVAEKFDDEGRDYDQYSYIRG